MLLCSNKIFNIQRCARLSFPKVNTTLYLTPHASLNVWTLTCFPLGSRSVFFLWTWEELCVILYQGRVEATLCDLWGEIIKSCNSALLSWNNNSWNPTTAVRKSNSYMDMPCAGVPTNSPSWGPMDRQHQPPATNEYLAGSSLTLLHLHWLQLILHGAEKSCPWQSQLKCRFVEKKLLPFKLLS